ncbi:PREDICTED: uncharacterized protein LOC104760416 [Camelina sativa]|uniref:Uncharacterized protein LOC104760416 n=1 Tax=Camelina sativa TaxID=90675 RepID=A0ABM0X6X8_CAMSA|nr:PREDICTED: uncharacterized protein LOC104760416 [Camelina sativa]
MVRLDVVGEGQTEANLVYYGGGSFERSFKSTRQRKLYLTRLLMNQFIAVKELINDFTFAHPELSAKETCSSGSARRRTSPWMMMMNETVMEHKQQHSAVPKTTLEEELAERKKSLRLRELALLQTVLELRIKKKNFKM